MDGARQRAGIVRSRTARARLKSRTAPSTSPQNSSSWRRPRSCIAIPSASPCSIACCGGCGAITNCWRSRPIRTWPRSPAMAKAVRRDEHKMHAFVRFREVGRETQGAFRRLVRAGASHRRAGGAVLRPALRRHALVDPDAGPLRALGRPRRFLHAGRQPNRTRRPRTGWRKSGAAITPASSIRRG